MWYWVCDEWSHHLNSVQDGTTALYIAAQTGHVKAVEVLIAAKALVDIQKKVKFTLFNCFKLFQCVQDGATALLIASAFGHCGVVRMLLEAKADVNNKANVSHAAWWCLCTLLIPF